jgi:hypothetical protein
MDPEVIFFDAVIRQDGGLDDPLEAEVWYTLDMAYGLPVGSKNGAVEVFLLELLPDLEIDPAYRGQERHLLDTGERLRVEMGWNADGEPVYLSPVEAAVGFWRVKFPRPGHYAWRLPGLPTRSLVVGEPKAALVPPTLSRRAGSPLAPHPALVLGVSFTGTYPAGGFDFGPAVHGVGVPRFIDVQDTPLYRFVPDIPGQKLHVYNAGAAEVSGAIDFTTQALIFGEVL